MRFLDVKTDFAFKKIFGSEGSKDILLSFVNAVLDFEGKRVVNLEILDPYQIPLVAGMKDTYVDLKARLDNGTWVIIEMQVLNVEGFEQRILYNAAKSYSTQIVRGEEYATLMPVVALTLTDFIMFPDIPEVRSEYRMKEVEHMREYNSDLKLVFYELPKFLKSIDELDSIEDKWLFFVKQAGSLEMKPETLVSVPEISHALDIANEAGMTCQELEIQNKRRDFIILQRGSIKKAMKDGFTEGHAQGIAEGIAEGFAQGYREERLRIVTHLKAMGISIQEIVRITGLSEDEVVNNI